MPDDILTMRSISAMQLLTDWPDKQAAKFETSGISGKSYTPMQSLSHTLQFQFYSGDATDVSERLDHGSLDFAVMLQPIDSIKYEFLSLPDRSEWGILMTKKDPLASKKSVTKDDLKSIPLIMHQRIGLQSEIAHWAGTDLENLNIAATYNVVHGSPVPFVQQDLGYFLTTRDLLAPVLDLEVCFLSLEPKLSTQLALVWKKHAVFSKAAEMFIKHIIKN